MKISDFLILKKNCKYFIKNINDITISNNALNIIKDTLIMLEIIKKFLKVLLDLILYILKILSIFF